MAYYLFQAEYTREAWDAIVKHSQNREEALRPVVEKMGGSLHGFWIAFGEYGTVAIIQLPDHVSAQALSMAISAGGAMKALKTTLLMTMDEVLQAAKQSSAAGYRPPKN